MSGTSEAPVLPYPLILISVTVLTWPIFFSGQWDEVALIGFGILIGLLGLLAALRSYPLVWNKCFWPPVIFIAWLTIVVMTANSATDAGWASYAWWAGGIVLLFLCGWLTQLNGFIKVIFSTVLITQLVGAGVALFMVAKDPTQRATGLLYNANGFGGYALWGVVVLFAVLIFPQRRRWLGWVGFGSIALAFLATVSLTAMVALLLTGVVGLFASRTWWNKKRMMSLAVTILVVFGIGLSVYQIPRVRTLMDLEHVRFSFTQRLEFARAAWQMGLDRPLTGWGVGSFQVVYPQYAHQVNEQPKYPHNLFIQLFAETGTVGAMLWILLVLTIGIVGWRGWRNNSSTDGRMLMALWFGWLAFTLHMLFDFSWQFPAGQVLWWASSGLFLGYAFRSENTIVWFASRRERLGIALVALSMIFWMGRFTFSLSSMRTAEAAVNQGNPDQEISALQKAVFWQPNRERISRLSQALWLHRSNDDLEKTQHLLELALERNSEDYTLYYWYGNVLHAQDHDTQALEAFKQAYVHDPVFHLEHAIEYARELGQAGKIEEKNEVIETTLARYKTWQRFDRSPITMQLEALKNL